MATKFGRYLCAVHANSRSSHREVEGVLLSCHYPCTPLSHNPGWAFHVEDSQVVPDITKSNFGYGDIINPFPKAGSWVEVAQKGGEGEGESWYTVKHFVDHDIFIKLNGFYTSYDGTDFDGYDYKEVLPHQEVITVYR